MIPLRICRRLSCGCRKFSSSPSVPKTFFDPFSKPASDSVPEKPESRELVLNEMKAWIATQEKSRSELRKMEENVGLEKFDRSLTANLERYRQKEAGEISLIGSEKWKALGLLIADKNASLPARQEHRYQLKPGQEMVYKEVMYDNDVRDRVNYRVAEKFAADYRPPVKQAAPRNLVQNSLQARQFADSNKPKYPTHPHPMVTPIGNYTDEYHWLHSETHRGFPEVKEGEEMYCELVQKRFEILKGTIQSDLDSYLPTPDVIPLHMGNYVYRRNTTGAADFLTIYRSPADDSQTRSTSAPQSIFGLDDVFDWYKTYADTSPDIKAFVETLRSRIESSPADPMVDFLVDLQDRYLAVSFALDGRDNPKSILIKDLKENKLLPVVIQNAGSGLGFEAQSIYFVETDMCKRPHKVYRYDIEKNKKALVYEEPDKNYFLNLEQSRSGEYLFIGILSNYEPRTNEVWFKAAQKGGSFTLYNPMQYGVSYSLQQSGEYLYAVTNEGRPFHYLVKSRIPDELLFKHSSSVAALENSPHKLLLPPVPPQVPSTSVVSGETLSLGLAGEAPKLIPAKPENQIVTEIKTRQTPSQYFLSRDTSLEAYNKALTVYQKQHTSLVAPMMLRGEVFSESFGKDPILDCAVFQHYLLALTGEAAAPKLVAKSLLKESEHRIQLIEAPLSVTFEVNRRHQTHTATFSTTHVSHPEIYHEYNIPLRKFQSRPVMVYEGLDTSRYTDERVMVKARDGLEVPIRLLYHKAHFSESSPAILYTAGSRTNPQTMGFKPWLSAALDRGCTIIYPELRGTRTMDLNWYAKGIQQNKITHFTDLGDVANYIKQQKIASKLAAIGEGISGAVTVATVMLKEPQLFESVSILV